jgi:hypothetical protein
MKRHLIEFQAPTPNQNRGSRRLKLGTLQPSKDLLGSLLAAQGEKRILQQLVLKKELGGFGSKRRPLHTTIQSKVRAEKSLTQLHNHNINFEQHQTAQDLADLIEVNMLSSTKEKYRLNLSTNHSGEESEGQQLDADFKQARSYKLADLDDMIADGLQHMKENLRRPTGARGKNPAGVLMSPNKTKTIVAAGSPTDDDSFVNTTKAFASVISALAVFREDYSMRMVQAHVKEATLIMGSELSELDIPPQYQGDLIKLGVTMLRCEIYPSVYFVSGIWKNMSYLLIMMIRRSSTDKEVAARASEYFQTLRFYCKTDKLDVNSEVSPFLKFFQELFAVLHNEFSSLTKPNEANSSLGLLLKTLASGFIAFLGWNLKHLDNGLSTEHSFGSVDEIPPLLRNPQLNNLCYDVAFDYIDQAFSTFPDPEALISQVALNNLRNHIGSLLFKHEISDLGKSGGSSSTMFWSTIVFQLMLILMKHPQTSGLILERWISTTDVQQDRGGIEFQQNREGVTMLETCIGLTGTEGQHGSLLNYFLDLLVRFTTSIFRDQGRYVKTYSTLIDRLDMFLESIPPNKNSIITRTEKDLLCRLNVLIFEAMKDIKNKVLGLSVAPFIRALVTCSIKTVERSDSKEKRAYLSLVKNGFYEIIQLFHKPKMMVPSNQHTEEMQNIIILILNFFRRNST